MAKEQQPDQRSPQDLAKRLDEVEERFRLFMENVREYAVFMMDPEGHVVDWNFGAEKILGYGPEIVGQPFGIFFPPDDVKSGVPDRELRKAVKRAMTAGTSARMAPTSGRSALRRRCVTSKAH